MARGSDRLHIPVSFSSHFFIERGTGALYVRAVSTPQPANQSLGRLGEQLALEHYERLGFTLIARNHRTRTASST